MINEIGQTILTGTRFELQVTDYQDRFSTISEFDTLEDAQLDRETTRTRYPDHEFRIIQVTTSSEVVDTDEDFKANLLFYVSAVEVCFQQLLHHLVLWFNQPLCINIG